VKNLAYTKVTTGKCWGEASFAAIRRAGGQKQSCQESLKTSTAFAKPFTLTSPKEINSAPSVLGCRLFPTPFMSKNNSTNHLVCKCWFWELD